MDTVENKQNEHVAMLLLSTVDAAQLGGNKARHDRAAVWKKRIEFHLKQDREQARKLTTAA